MRQQFLRAGLLMLVLSLVLGLGVIIAVMVVSAKSSRTGEKFLAESLAFLFGEG